MKKPKVSIIILNYCGYHDTTICLKSLEKTRYENYEIILIDNGSKKDEKVKLRKYCLKHLNNHNKIRIFRLKKNLGFTGGNNFALNKTDGKYIVLLNNDTIVTKNWLSPLVDHMEKDKSTAVIQPKILQMNDNERFDYAGAAGGFIDKYGYPFTRGRIFNSQEHDRGQYDGVSKIFWASGSACMIRKSVINKVNGLFSENLFNYMEEIDFCWRVWNRGYKVMYTPNSIVYHKGASTAKRNLYKKRFWEHRNNLFILARNLDLHEFIFTMPKRALLELVTYLEYITKGEWTYLKSLFAAHLNFFTKLFIVRLKRNRLPNSKNKPVYPGSIAYDYFIRKKTKFNQLNWSPKGNISFLTFHNIPSGGLKMIFTFANCLKDRGYNVNIYSVLNRDQPSWFKLNTNFTNISKYYFNEKTDILITSFWPTQFVSLLLKAKKKYYLVQGWEENFYKNPLIKSIVKQSYKFPGEIITVNNSIKTKLKKNISNSKEIHVIKTPIVDAKVFNTKNIVSRSDSSRKQKINVLSVISRYNFQKGPDILEKVIQEIKKRYDNYEFTLVSFEDRKYSNVIDKFYSKISPSHISKLYKRANVLLITSRFEGLLGVGLEAMACGCPIVTTNVPGVTDYAKHMYNAYVIKNISDLWINNSIEKLLSDKKLVSKLTKNGIETAKEYSIKSATEILEKVLFE
ncbi:MAG: glycosyltransferase [Candidatus Woesebacteria bacterium]|jgi:GT2 family glycosyltransferase